MSTITIPVLSIFPLLSLLAVCSVAYLFVYTEHHSYFQSIRSSHVPFIFPGTATGLETHYTGFAPLDQYLTDLQLIFKHVIDGSRYDLSVLGLEFGGAMLGVFTAMLGEAVVTQGGGVGALIDLALWGLAIQYLGYFVSMPLYCFFHLRCTFYRPHTNDNVKTGSRHYTPNPSALAAIPWSMALGFVLPSVLLCVPGLFTPSQRQRFLGLIWQNFPLWIALLQYCISRLFFLESSFLESAAVGRGGAKPPSVGEISAAVRKASRRIIHLCATLHIIASACVVLASLPVSVSSSGPYFLRSLLPKEQWQRVHYKDFFSPPLWTEGSVKLEPDTWGADGAFNFLRYDYFFGTVAAVAWAVIVGWHNESGEQGKWGTRVERRGRGGQWTTSFEEAAIFVLWFLVAGPGEVVLSLMTDRWVRVLNREEKKLA